MNKDEKIKAVKTLADSLGVTAADLVSKKNAAYILLDRSGSMASNWNETIESVNAYVKTLDKDVDVYFAVFDSEGYPSQTKFEVVRDCKAAKFGTIGSMELSPRGGTPLYDSAARIMNKMLADGAGRAVLTVVTDGEENTSREWNLEKVKDLLKQLESKDYAVVYIGSGFKEVEKYATQTFDFAATNTAYAAVGNYVKEANFRGLKTAAYFNSVPGSADSFNSMAYSAAEKTELAATPLDIEIHGPGKVTATNKSA